jgi:hypothetical protein
MVPSVTDSPIWGIWISTIPLSGIPVVQVSRFSGESGMCCSGISGEPP